MLRKKVISYLRLTNMRHFATGTLFQNYGAEEIKKPLCFYYETKDFAFGNENFIQTHHSYEWNIIFVLFNSKCDHDKFLKVLNLKR